MRYLEYSKKIRNICIQIQYNEGMAKKLIKARGYDKLKSTIVKKLAVKWGVTEDYIYKILNGERDHEEIFEEYMAAKEGLVAAVEKLIPFN